MAPEVGISDHDKKDRFRDKEILTALWKQCRIECEAGPGNAEMNNTGDSTFEVDIRAKLLDISQKRHNFIPPLGNQPAESMLTHLIKLHKKRSTEFFPLSRVSNFSEGRDVRVEPTKIRGTPFFLDSQLTSNKKNNDFLLSAESFCHAVRVLMHGYTLVSMQDPQGDEWCSLGAAQRHIATVEGYPRANSRVSHRMRTQIMEAEMATRLEWTKLGQTNPGVSLTAIIDTVAQRRAIWPLNSEITRAITTRTKGQGKWTNWSNDWNSPPKGGLCWVYKTCTTTRCLRDYVSANV